MQKASQYSLGRNASFWVSAAVVVHTLWTSASPAMIYPLYTAQWDLTIAVTNTIYAVFPIVVVAVLVLFGGLADVVGRRSVILMGLGFSLSGCLTFAVAPSIHWVFAGRILMAVGVGLMASPSTAAILEFSDPGLADRANSITTAAQAVGFGAATLIGGALVQYAPLPTQLSFWLLSFLLGITIVFAWFLPRSSVVGTVRREWRPTFPRVPRRLWLTFATSSSAGIVGWVVGGIMLALGAEISQDLIRSDNVLVNGAVIAVFALVWGICSAFAKHLPAAKAIIVGGIFSIASMAALVASVGYHSLTMFLASASCGGVGYSFLLFGALSLLNAHAPSHHRAGTFSAFYLTVYLTQGIIAVGLGMIATTWNLETAIDSAAAMMASISGVTVLLGAVYREPAAI